MSSVRLHGAEPSSLADRLVASLLATTLGCTTLVFGGRTAVGQATFLVLSLVTATVFFCIALYRGTRVRPSWVDVPIVLAILLFCFQLVPLPQSALERLSPALVSMFPARSIESIPSTPAVDSGMLLPRWETLSLAPRETFCQLGLVLSGWLLSLVARHQIRSRSQIATFFDLLAYCTTVLSAFAIAQFALSNGKFFWVYQHPFASTIGAVNGSFTNPNHFGEFVALVIAWPVWRVLRSEPATSLGDEKPYWRSSIGLSTACIAVMLPAVLLSFSRNAMASCGVSVGLTTLIAYLTASPEFKVRIRMRVTAAVMVILGIAAIALIGMGERAELQVGKNFSELTSSDVETLDFGGTRRKIWATVLRGAADFPAVGIGLGAHASTYHRYWEGPEWEATFTHAENGPLQLLFETGVVGVSLLCLTVLVVVFRLGRSLTGTSTDNEHRAIAAIALVVLATSCCQSLADFSWYVPAIAGTVAVIVSIAVGATGPQLSRFGPRSIPIAGLVLSVVTLAVFAPQALQAAKAESHWNSYLITSRSSDDSVRVKILATQDLIRTLKCDPMHPEANESIARMYQWMFDLGQKRNERLQLAELRDAVRSGGWTSNAEYQAWLNDESIVGEMLGLLKQARHHAVIAYNQHPLDVETTILLSNTNFLETYDEPINDIYSQQLARIAPENSLALAERSSHAFRIGNVDDGIDLLLRAYANGPKLRRLLLSDLAKLISASELTDRLELTGDELTSASSAYRDAGKPSEAKDLQRMAAVWFEDRAEGETSLTEKFWWLDKAVTAYRGFGEYEHAAALALERVDIEPSDAKARSTLADILVKLERWPEAIRHYEQCAASSGEPNRWDGKLAQCRKMLAEHEAVMMHASGASPAVR